MEYERLLLSEATVTKKISLNDAFGKSRSGCEEKFPQVRLSVLGNVVLRAMSHEFSLPATIRFYRCKLVSSGS